MDKKRFLEKVDNEDDTPLFTLSDKERDICESLRKSGKLVVDDVTKILELTDDGKKELKRLKSSEESSGGISIYGAKFTKAKEVEVRKEAENALEEINNTVPREPGALSSIKEVASLAFMYGEDSESVRDSIKFYKIVSNLSALSKKVVEQS